ncbi:hypothetical protein L3Q82_013713 [Scortum barcoo]|uniref:Uncharacterized protein n=1 Tax=Scortum barcoo TaxID=214431 RepID=A0ACB8W1I7_9TELE|nr:hypothetical protein L3Q82_013713 [Scortum barcoo]
MEKCRSHCMRKGRHSPDSPENFDGGEARRTGAEETGKEKMAPEAAEEAVAGGAGATGRDGEAAMKPSSRRLTSMTASDREKPPTAPPARRPGHREHLKVQFNTIQPRLLWDKLQLAGVDHHLTSWMDFGPPHSQTTVCEGEGSQISFSVAPVLRRERFWLLSCSPSTLQTFPYNTPSCHLQKFSDDSAVVGLITDGDDREYRGLIQDFVDWCLRNNLQINAGKTKELVVDFQQRSTTPPALHR